MSVGPITNNGVTWESLLNQLNGLGQTDAIEQISDTNRSVTFTTTVNGTPTTVTMKIPDDLELPSEVTPEAIDTLIEKLGTGTDALPKDQLDALKSEITKIYSSAAKALTSAAVAPGRVMFDLYQLMALLVEVGQAQRNATRDLRNTQNQQIQNSIQAQADAQRNAAIVGLAVGVTCGLISAGISLGMVVGQGAAYKTQVNTARSSGMDAAQNKVNMLQQADTPEHAQARLDKVVGAKGGEALKERISSEIGQSETVHKAHYEYDVARGLEVAKREVDAAKTPEAQTQLGDANRAVETAQGRVESTSSELNDALDAPPPPDPEDCKIVEDRTAAEAKEQYVGSCVRWGTKPNQDILAKYDNAISAESKLAAANESGQGVEAAQNEFATAKADLHKALDEPAVPDPEDCKIADGRTAAEAKEQYVGSCNRWGVEPKEEIIAKYDSAIEAERGLAAAKETVANHPITKAQARYDSMKASAAQLGIPEFEQARAEYRTSLELAADGYADTYERAVASGAPKSEIEQARKDMVMARAYVNNEIMKDPDLRTTATEYKSAMLDAKGAVRVASESLNANLDYRDSLRRIETLTSLNAINTAIGNVLQSMTQSISSEINSNATRMGAEQQKEQEQLDQTKDLFQQAQSLIDSVIQLMQAVRQAETQSMRDAIQA